MSEKIVAETLAPIPRRDDPAGPAPAGRQKKLVYRVVALVAVLVALAFSLFGYIFYSVASPSLTGQINARITQAGQSASDGIQKWMTGRTLLIQTLADNLALSRPDGIGGVLSRDTLAKVFTHIHYGGQDGTFTRQPAAKMPDGYDPRQRDWYQSVLSAKQTVLLKP